MSEDKVLYAFFTVADGKLEAFLTQVVSKLGGKKFGAEGKVIAVFTQAERACHGAMYFMKKCAESDLLRTKIVVLHGTQTNLIKDAQFLYQNAEQHQCTITGEVLDQLNDIQIETEPLANTQLPTSAQTTFLHNLIKFKNLSIEVTAEDLFDYSNVIEVASMEPEATQPPPKEAETSNLIDGPLEISQVNQIYDYQQEQVIRKQEKIEKEQNVQTTTAVPSYANEQLGTPSPAEGTSQANDMSGAPPTDDEMIAADMSYDVPPPGLKGIVQDKNLLATLILGTLSLCCIGYFAISGNIPFVSSNDDSAYEDEYGDSYEDEGEVALSATSEVKPEPKLKTPPKKRVFTPILTEEEPQMGKNAAAPTFPQEPGPDTAYLSIQSSPPGATVIINGARLKGETPLKTFLVHANKKLEIKIQKPGYDSINKSETIPPGKRRGFIFELIPNN